MPQQTHPSRDELSAYSLGQLPEAKAVAIDSHISECEACCQTIVGLSSDDTFMGLLKEARQLPADQTVAHDSVSVQPFLSSQDVPEPLAEHPRYEIEGLIGKGGMGDVYRATHRMMKRTVALKIIKPEFVQKLEAVDRFHREVTTAAQLSHPNIVTAYDAERAGDIHFLVMEFVDGVDLSHIIKERGPLPVADACDYVRQAAIGLQYAHEQGMVHRDIKPHNLMVMADGTVKILDFGLASLAPAASSNADTIEARSDLTAVGSIMGTPDFISPEQAEDARQADIRSDIYSLGTTLYFLLSGQPPFSEGSVMQKLKSHAQAEPEPLGSLREDVPDELAKILSRMIAKDPDERFQTPAEVAQALSPFAVTAPDAEYVSAPASDSWTRATTMKPPKAETRCGARQWVAFVVCLCLLGGVGTGKLFQKHSRRQRMEKAAVQLRTYLETGDSDQLSLNSLDVLLSHPDGYGHLQELDAEFDRLLFTESGLPHDLDGAALLLHDDRIGSRRPELTLRTARENFTGGPSVKLPQQLRVDAVQLQVGSAYEQKVVIRYWASTERRFRQAVEETMQLKPGAEYTVAVAVADIIQDRVDWTDIWRDGQPTGVDTAELTADLENIQGEWQVTYFEETGRVVPNELVQRLRHVFSGKTLTMIADKQELKTTFTLDPSTAPKAISVVEDGEVKLGIYELKGETLRVCWGKDQERPTEFVSEPRSANNALFVLKRVGPGTVADRKASYYGGRLTIKGAARNTDGKVAITFKTMPETVWYCPGANATSRSKGVELTFVRAPFNSKPKVDLPATPINRPHTLDRVIVVDAKDQPIFLREGKNRKLIWSPDRFDG